MAVPVKAMKENNAAERAGQSKKQHQGTPP